MDWRVVSLEAERVLTLSAADAATYLARLREDEPDLSDHVTRLVRRTRHADTFMGTSAEGDEERAGPSLQPGDHVGVWRVEGFVGAGGMGEVYRAARADGLYDHVVALKVLPGHMRGDRAEAFERERRRLARLDDPRVSRIIDGGAGEDGRPFMAMEFVDGPPIGRYCEERGVPRAGRLRLVADVCRAVSHAHARLILHRDIKASNVLVTQDGHIKLIDFGIASLADDDDADGVGPLTLATAAPEQLFGEPVSVATDVFGIGMLAHHLLVGRLPERLPSGAVAIDAVGLRDKDVRAILARATAFSPDKRYPSADALAEDLHAYLSYEPVSARGGGRLYRVGKFLRRYPVASSLATFAVLALAGGLVASIALNNRVRENLARAEFFLREAEFNDQLQTAWSDALLRLFDNDADVERQTELLLARWREAYDARGADPETAAIISLAIGNHFSVRHDDQTARRILEPLIEEGFGSDITQRHAKLVTGYVYASLGETDKAAALLREADQAYAAGYHAYSYDHVATVSWLARTTMDPADIERAIHVNSEFLKVEENIEYRITAMNYLGNMYEFSGNLEMGYRVAQDVVELIRNEYLGTTATQGAAEAKLAMFELYYMRDVGKAETLVDEVIQGGASEYGVNRQTGRALTFAGDIALARGDLAEAEARLRDALPILERFGGTQSHYYWNAVFSLVEVLAADGRFAEADDLMAAVNDISSDDDPLGMIAARHILAEAFVMAYRDGSAAAGSFLDGAALDKAVLKRDPASASKLDDLLALSVAAPG